MRLFAPRASALLCVTDVPAYRTGIAVTPAPVPTVRTAPSMPPLAVGSGGSVG